MNQAITAGSEVRITFGKLRGRRGEVLKIEGRHVTVATVGGTVTLLMSQLEAV